MARALSANSAHRAIVADNCFCVDRCGTDDYCCLSNIGGFHLTNPISDFDANKIEFLEKINELIDLCIDNGCYDTIKEMIPDAALSDSKEIRRLRDMKPESEAEQKYSSSFSLGNTPYPVKEVRMLSDLQGKYPEKCSADSVILEDIPILRPWSCLFWAKLVRAELHKQNRDPWLKLYEKLILYLEANIGLCLPKDLPTDSNNYEITLLNYLMELSAASFGEASFGYAERARDLSNEVLKDFNKEVRDKNGHPYDRWIWYNKGIAYQHTRRHQEAIGQFVEVINKFVNQFPDTPAKKDFDAKDFDAYVEFLLNIAPAILQTAAINIQGQLAYHALKSLSDKRLNGWLDSASEKYKDTEIILEVANRVGIRRDILRLEALLRLGNPKVGEKEIKELHSKHRDVFGDEDQYKILPIYDTLKPPTLFQVRFIEQKVIWYREEAIQLLDSIERKKNGTDSNEDKNIEDFKDRIGWVADRYWMWVLDNPHDRNVYFSNWAQFLKIGMRMIRRFIEYGRRFQEYEHLLRSIIALYDKHRESLPNPNNKKKEGKGRIVLEALRSDDPFDIIGGLNDFYDGMIYIKSHGDAETQKAQEFIMQKEGKKGDEYYDQLKKDHFQLLHELDRWDLAFGEHQRIEALTRCNNLNSR